MNIEIGDIDRILYMLEDRLKERLEPLEMKAYSIANSLDRSRKPEKIASLEAEYSSLSKKIKKIKFLLDMVKELE